MSVTVNTSADLKVRGGDAIRGRSVLFLKGF